MAEATPPSRPSATRSGRIATSLATSFAIGAVTVGAVVAQLLRQRGTHAWDTIWAEDGLIYHAGTRSASQLLDSYAGYLQLLPRLIGYGGHAVALEDLAVYYSVAGALVGACCGLAVWFFASQLIRSQLLRAALGLSVVLLPVLIIEQLANGVDTNWPILFAGWWALLYRPTSLRAAAFPAAVAFLAVTSNAMGLAYAPLVLVLVWRERDWATRVVGGGYFLGALVQVAVLVGSPRPQTVGPTLLSDLPQIYAVRVLGSALVGEHWVGRAWNRLGVEFAILSVVAVGLLVVSLAVLSTNRARAYGVLSIVYGALVWGACFYGRGTVYLRVIPGDYRSPGARFCSFGIWMLLSGVFILASAVRSDVIRRGVVVVLVAQFAVVAAMGFRADNGRSGGPPWSASVATATASCATERPGHTVLVYVLPPAPGWAIPVKCRDLVPTGR